jgi:serine/threonine protein kinase
VNELPTVPGGIAAGSQIAGYTIEEQIGRGGMAVVYRASDKRLNRHVALKILAPELASDAGYRQRFLREMRAAAAVDHPNIVPVFDAGEADGALFIAMRYVDGQDISSPRPRPRLTRRTREAWCTAT